MDQVSVYSNKNHMKHSGYASIKSTKGTARIFLTTGNVGKTQRWNYNTFAVGFISLGSWMILLLTPNLKSVLSIFIPPQSDARIAFTACNFNFGAGVACLIHNIYLKLFIINITNPNSYLYTKSMAHNCILQNEFFSKLTSRNLNTKLSIL